MNTTVRNQHSAFTLIELLVVIGIISLFMGILLPALTKSREEARNVICATHLDQIFKAVYMYATANDERLPHLGWAPYHREWVGQTNKWWPVQLAELLNGETELYVCPSDEDPYRAVQVVPMSGETFVVSTGSEVGRFPLEVTYRGSCDAMDLFIGRRITDWDHPSNALIFIETNLTSERYGGADPLSSRECFHFNPDLLDIATEDWYETSAYVGTWERHNGRSNFLFLDGGISRHTPREVSNIAREQEYWETGGEKRPLNG